jgi:hypothetical protein
MAHSIIPGFSWPMRPYVHRTCPVPALLVCGGLDSTLWNCGPGCSGSGSRPPAPAQILGGRGRTGRTPRPRGGPISSRAGHLEQRRNGHVRRWPTIPKDGQDVPFLLGHLGHTGGSYAIKLIDRQRNYPLASGRKSQPGAASPGRNRALYQYTQWPGTKRRRCQEPPRQDRWPNVRPPRRQRPL